MTKIHLIQTGTVEIKQKQIIGEGQGTLRQLNMLLDAHWAPPVPIFAWAIEHAEGVIVVDTGETARTADSGYLPWWHPYYRLSVRLHVEPEEEIGPQLKKIGIEAKDVKTVILTHMHTDHAGGLSHFPHSRIMVHPGETALARGFAGQLRGYLSSHYPSWFDPQPIVFESAAVGPFEHSCKVTAAGDVMIVPTHGHTPAHVSVIVLADDMSYFLAGDTTYSERTLIQQQVDGVSPDETQARRSIRTIAQYTQTILTIYLPAHDPDSAKRLQGKIPTRA